MNAVLIVQGAKNNKSCKCRAFDLAQLKKLLSWKMA